MTTRYYGVALGGDMKTDVTEDSSTTSAAIELAVVYDASGMTKTAVLKAVEAIKQHIITDNWPPV